MTSSPPTRTRAGRPRGPVGVPRAGAPGGPGDGTAWSLPPSQEDRPARRSRPGVAALALALALAAAAAVWASWWAFVTTTTGQAVDEAAFRGATFGRSRLWTVASDVLEVVSVGSVAAVLLGAAAIALARRRWGLAVQVALLMGGANVTTRLLKHVVLERPDLGVSYAGAENALPSGHTTAAASVSAALLLVVPPRVRPWAALLGAAFTAATGFSVLVGQWHRPSDVVAALAVVLVWGAAACALVALAPRRVEPPAVGRADTAAVPRADLATAGAGRGRGVRRAVTGLLLVAGLVLAAVGALALARTAEVVRTAGAVPDGRADLVTSYLGAGSGVVGASALTFALLLALRQAAGERPPRRG
ncbi:phosphatase PAP2 family protein [Cellulomonas endophytica]|uniref:phosphatase PAP2 family protein n=1 Tax=Cellulomonas endophytica TaxID=2494735 RepID=UPI001F0C4B78|nr:phosphatase PAP2 family protein [Cellulomonas endophytica]